MGDDDLRDEERRVDDILLDRGVRDGQAVLLVGDHDELRQASEGAKERR